MSVGDGEKRKVQDFQFLIADPRNGGVWERCMSMLGE